MSNQPSIAQGEWKPVFEADGPGSSLANAQLEIQLPAGLPQDTIDRLGYELDGIDLSAVVTYLKTDAGLAVSIESPQQLEPGQHELRVVEFTEAGEILERGVWRFQVESGDAERTQVLSGNLGLSFGSRVSDNLESASNEARFDGAEHGAQGGAQLEARLRRGASQVHGVADLVVDTNREESFALDDERNSDIELGEYLFTGERPGISALLGHHAVDQQGLLMQDFHRRGASVNTESAGGHLASSGFAFRTEPITGWRNGLGVNDPDNRVIGGAVSLNPFGNDNRYLTLTGMMLRGEGDASAGVGVAGGDGVSSGDGVALILESHLLDSRLRLRAESAATDHDSDAESLEFTPARDNAHSFLVSVIPWGGLDSDSDAGLLEIGAEMQQIGPSFRSMANTSLPTDRKLTRLFSAFTRGGLSVQAQVANERDNVDNSPEFPVLENDIAELTVNYAPPLRYSDQGEPVYGWLGQPSIGMTSQFANIRHKSLASDLESLRIDRETPNHRIELGFLHTSWDWSAGYGWGEQRDQTDALPTLDNEQVDFSLIWRVQDRLELGAFAQSGTFERTGVVEDRSRAWGLTARVFPLPNKLSLGVEFSLNDFSANDDLLDLETRTIGANLEWQVVPPRNNHSGLAFWISGEQQQRQDSGFPNNDGDQYQVLMGIRLDWLATTQLR